MLVNFFLAKYIIASLYILWYYITTRNIMSYKNNSHIKCAILRIDFETIEDISYLESVSSIKDFDVKRKNTSQKMEVKSPATTTQPVV